MKSIEKSDLLEASYTLEATAVTPVTPVTRPSPRRHPLRPLRPLHVHRHGDLLEVGALDIKVVAFFDVRVVLRPHLGEGLRVEHHLRAAATIVTGMTGVTVVTVVTTVTAATVTVATVTVATVTVFAVPATVT